jgi:predicted helicase
MLAGKNIGFITTRQTRDKWDILATKYICDHKSCAAYDTNSLFPLYVYTTPENSFGTLFSQSTITRSPNLTQKFISEMKERLELEFILDDNGDLVTTFAPEDIFNYIYAIFHSPTYRSRYAEFLKIDFPRLPLASNVELFRNLCILGKELVGLHLLESPLVEEPNWASPVSYMGSQPSSLVAAGFPKFDSNTVTINASEGFKNIPEAVWNFYIGGYQVCHKWLKDRRGRQLSSEDIAHYKKIVYALGETIRLMGEVDAAIESAGGWPIK